MEKGSKNSKLFIFFFLLFLNFIIWGKPLLSLVLNGDDVIVLFEAQKYLTEFFTYLFSFSEQYRPLGRALFSIYLIFKYNFHQVYLVHLLLFTFIQFLFFLLSRQKLNTPFALILSCFVFYNPIFYYHIFAVASDMNLEIICLLMTIVLLIQKKKYLLVLPLFMAAILIKETFVLLIPLVIFSLLKAKITTNSKIILICTLLTITIGYLAIRFTSYKVTDENYRFVFTIAKMKENVGNISAWLINHPRGAEFGFYGFRNIVNYLLSGILLVMWIVGGITTFKKDSTWFVVLFGVFMFSIIPFIFLNRTLFFYMDAPFIVLGLLLVSALQSRLKFLWISLMLASILISHSLFFNKWINYSFVGNSNLIAKNFINSVSKESFKSDTNLCIINHSLGSWPTQNGNLIYFLNLRFSGKITSINSSNPALCGNSVIFKNEGAEYIRI